MKKFTAIILAAFMVLSLAACSSGTPGESADTANSEITSSAESGAATESAESAEPAASAEPETTAPEIPDVETIEPETTAPETVEPETSAPETSAPETTKPEVTEPATSKPETSAPQTTTPATTKPENTKPVTTKPVTTKPVTTKPETTSPVIETEEPEVIEKEDISDPVTLLNSVWALFAEDEKFAVTGGDFSSEELIQEAGSFSLENPDSIDYVAGFPAAEIGNIDSAATLMHMMNQNTFTAGAYHVADGADIAALSKAIRNNIMERMWMCGFPDKLIVVNVGDYIVSAFGKNQPIDNFAAHLVEAYPTAKIVVDEPILL